MARHHRAAPEIADLEAKRKWVRDHDDESARDEYLAVEGKLRLLDAILRGNWISADETLKLQCLDVTFGDALAQQLGLTWVVVDDECGRDPALMVEGSSLRVFPLTSISKRVERGEDVDVYADVPHAKKITLDCPNGYNPRLGGLVEDFIRGGVLFVGVVGKVCARVGEGFRPRLAPRRQDYLVTLAIVR